MSKGHLTTIERTNLLNIQYGVCFGAIFSTTFAAIGGPPEFRLALVLPTAHLLPFVALLLYLAVDWVGITVVAHQVEYRWWQIVIASFGIWLIGLLVNLARMDGAAPYFLTGSYLGTAAIYHILTQKWLYPLDDGRRVVGLILWVGVLLLAFYVAYLGYVVEVRRAAAGMGISAYSFVIVAALLVKCLNLAITSDLKTHENHSSGSVGRPVSGNEYPPRHQESREGELGDI